MSAATFYINSILIAIDSNARQIIHLHAMRDVYNEYSRIRSRGTSDIQMFESDCTCAVSAFAEVLMRPVCSRGNVD